MLKLIFEPSIWVLLGLRGDPGLDGKPGYGPQGLPGAVGPLGPKGHTRICKHTSSMVWQIVNSQNNNQTLMSDLKQYVNDCLFFRSSLQQHVWLCRGCSRSLLMFSGDPGRDGAKGVQGIPGIKGDQGLRGPRGLPSPQNITMPPGDQGEPGALHSEAVLWIHEFRALDVTYIRNEVLKKELFFGDQIRAKYIMRLGLFCSTFYNLVNNDLQW